MTDGFDKRYAIARWVAAEILPHERAVRAWLKRSRVAPEDADELVQEAYCLISAVEATDQIDRPDAYFFSIVRNLLIRRLRRERVVRIEAIAEIEAYQDELHPTPEHQAAAKLDYARMIAFISNLPERCREIVTLRKIEGWSQKRIATHMGTTEKAVEKQVWLGVRAVQRAWSEADRAAEARLAAYGEDRRGRRP